MPAYAARPSATGRSGAGSPGGSGRRVRARPRRRRAGRRAGRGGVRALGIRARPRRHRVRRAPADRCHADPPLPVENGSVAAVAQEVLPSTVQIVAQFQGQDDGATGSGFVLDTQGHFVTNNHVVADAAENDGPIQVVDQDGNRYEATVVGRSPTYDLAVLFVEERPGPAARVLGRVAGLHVGDPVVAFGSPLGLSSTVTAGIVSALNRPVTTGDSERRARPTSTPCRPTRRSTRATPAARWSTCRARWSGVNSAIATTGGAVQGEAGNIGVGFAIPVEQVKVTADQILRTGEARYPVIGAKVRHRRHRRATGAPRSARCCRHAGRRGRPAEGRRRHRARRHPGHRRHRADRGDPLAPPGRRGRARC